MTAKKLDQFMTDYFRGEETISVNANWLQMQLRQLETLKRVTAKQGERLALLDALNEFRELQCPEYYLDLKV